jgi:Zn-dependent protease
VSLAGPAANLAICIAFGLPFLLGFGGDTIMWAILAVSAFWQAVAFVLNMLPIPGLDGYGAIEPWLPAQVRDWGRRFRPYGFFLIVILFFASPGFRGAFQLTVFKILRLLQVDADAFAMGMQGMRLGGG